MTPPVPSSLKLGATIALAFAAFAAFEGGACSSSSTPLQNPTSAKREAEFCAARAAYKAVAAAAGGALDPAPGSPRAKFEAAEDAFCKTVGDAGQ